MEKGGLQTPILLNKQTAAFVDLKGIEKQKNGLFLI